MPRQGFPPQLLYYKYVDDRACDLLTSENASHTFSLSRARCFLLPYPSQRRARFDPLFIEDPMNFSNNVGRNCFRVYQIQRAWSDAHASLTRALDDESQLRSSPYRLLRCIISDPEPAPDS